MRWLLLCVFLVGCGSPPAPARPETPHSPTGLDGQPPCGIPSTAENPWPCGKPKDLDTEHGDQPQQSPDSTSADQDGEEDALQRFSREQRQKATETLRAKLSALAVSPRAPAGYDRKDWKHWIDEDGDCQDTRQEVLIEESEVEVVFETPKQCRVASGRWTCPYTDEVFINPRKLDIDHVVPLGEAYASGGQAWSPEERQRYANDLSDPDHLMAVKAGANRSKGKRGPDEWLPDVDRCQYAAVWIRIKQRWTLSATLEEESTLREVLDTCGTQAESCDPVDPLCQE